MRPKPVLAKVKIVEVIPIPFIDILVLPGTAQGV